MTIGIVKDSIFAVVCGVRLLNFYLVVIKVKIAIMSCVYYCEGLQLCFITNNKKTKIFGSTLSNSLVVYDKKFFKFELKIEEQHR